MTGSPYQQVVFAYKLLVLTSIYAVATSLQYQEVAAPFRFSDFLEATYSVIKPWVAAGSNRCESLKNMLGLSYNQMQGQNGSDFTRMMSIDIIRSDGNYKYNLTATKRIARILKNSTRAVILIHGFLESSTGLMVQGVAPALLNQSGLQVLALDGSKAITMEYIVSSTYARFMGEALGKFIVGLMKNGQDPNRIIMIGHSLGAHIAGIAGKTVIQATGQAIGRISALDPAGPCFSNTDLESKLDKRDAKFVDVIHTNAGVLGSNDPVGHQDFYPNGGLNQPGCILSTCDHTRAWEFFAESVSKHQNFIARKCRGWHDFKTGLCNNNTFTYMGWIAEPQENGIYFLSTSPSAPFGLGPAGSIGQVVST